MRDAIALVDGRPLAVALLEERLVVLRRSAGAGLLPATGSAQFRQLRRWIAQVLIIETICANGSLAADGADGGHPELDAAAAADFGSIVAAAYQANAGVRQAYERLTTVTPGRDPDPPVATPTVRQFHLWQAFRRSPLDPMPPLRAMGWVCPADVPDAIGRALSDAELGCIVGPVGSSLGEHVFVVDEVRDGPPSRAAPGPADEADQRRVFLDWLARQRRERVVEVTGYEHPADPRQPDHQHRH